MDIRSFFEKGNYASEKDTDNDSLEPVLIKLVEHKKITKKDSGILRLFKGNLTRVHNIPPILKKKNMEKINRVLKRKYPHYYNKKGFSTDNLSKTMVKNNKKIVPFSADQIAGINSIMEFLMDPKRSVFGLYGYAGTGKTTLVVQLVYFLLKHRLITSISLTAPTNKAVNVMKTKFRGNIRKLNKEADPLKPFDEQLEELKKKLDLKVEFVTIHRLLGYEQDVSLEGERTFVRKKDAKLHKHNLIIIDECSMIPKEIIDDIFKFGKKSKIIFVGDPAQLPPVSERISNIFSVEDELYKFYTLKNIVRTNNSNVVGLCQNIRGWVDGTDKPRLIEYMDDNKGVAVYQNEKDKDWIDHYIKNVSQESTNSNIILTWTNRQCNEYNAMVRKRIFNREDLERFEVGDVLIMNDFYSIGNDDTRFYTSEQLKIVDTDERVEQSASLTDEGVKSHKNSSIMLKFDFVLTTINSRTTRRYKVHKLSINRIDDDPDKETKIPEVYQISVIHNDDLQTWKDDKKTAADMIMNFRNFVYQNHRSDFGKVSETLIKELWRQFNKVFINPFANVTYGYSITVHKSQGSSYFNVYADGRDILLNKNKNECKRCVYTAITRTSNELHLLV